MERKGNGINLEMINEFNKAIESEKKFRVLQNAITEQPVNDLAVNRNVLNNTDNSFSHKIDDWTVTNQKKSGRCWLFAGLNVFRVQAMKKMNLKDFEFSQNFVLFWDKFERANYFFENIILTADLDIDDRKVAHLFVNGISDGGQWNMLAAVIKKYGLVPKAFMPETYSSSNTGIMNKMLRAKMLAGAKRLREAASKQASASNLQEMKHEFLQDIYRILVLHLGMPPERFVWQWEDKDKKFHRDPELTPREFAKKYLNNAPDDYICLVNDPRPYHPPLKTYTVEFLGNVIDGELVKYLNVDIKNLKDIAAKTLQSGEPVWFGCDVGHHMHRDKGLLDASLYEYEQIYDTELTIDKTARLEYKQSAMSHAMLFTGVDMLGDRPRRWRVENSWGEDPGNKGFFIMNDSWFDEYMFEIAAYKDYLPDEIREKYELEPIVLPPWDPMGSLAG
jgi:bleomycin hydrolase